MRDRLAWTIVLLVLSSLLTVVAWDVLDGQAAPPELPHRDAADAFEDRLSLFARDFPRGAHEDAFVLRADRNVSTPRPVRTWVGEPLRVTGRVVDEQGAPLAGARVTFVPSGDTLVAMGLQPPGYCDTWWMDCGPFDLGFLDLSEFPSATSDAGGRFALDARTLSTGDDRLAEGDTRRGQPENLLHVTLEGRARRWQRCSPALEPPEYDAGELTLVPEARVAGHVVDPSGAPVAGAVVRVDSDGGRYGEAAPSGGRLERPDEVRVVTADDGRFAFAALWPGQVRLEISADDLLPRVVQAATEPGVETALGDIELGPGETLRGIVVDEAGRPVPSVSLGISEWGRPSLGSHFTMYYADDAVEEELLDVVGVRVVTGDDGRFAFRHVGVPEVMLWAVAQGFEPQRLAGVDVFEDARVVLRGPATLDVRVVGGDGQRPLADARLSATRLVGDGPRVRTEDIALRVASLGEGRFSIVGVGRAGTRLSVEAPGHATRELVADGLLPGERREDVVELEHADARASSRVSDEDEETEDGGLTTLDVDLRGARVAGEVRDAEGAPVAGLELGLLGDDGEITSTRTDEAGRGVWEAVPAGTYLVRTNGWTLEGLMTVKRWLADEFEVIEVGDDEREILGRWTATRPAALGGEVSLPSGGVVSAGARVSAVRLVDGRPARIVVWDTLHSDAGWRVESSEQVDRCDVRTSSGRYRFGSLRPGTYRVAVGADDVDEVLARGVEVELAPGEVRELDLHAGRR